MLRAVKVVHEKVRTAQGVVTEFKVWRIPKSEFYPEGVKYSLFAVLGKKVLVGYDNHKPKGHHRHFGEEEMAYEFSNFDKLREDFKLDLAKALEELK